MNRQIRFVVLAWILSMPFAAGQAKLMKLRPAPDASGGQCNRAGEFLSQDTFAQTFLLKYADDQMTTVPFSRSTRFFEFSPDSKGTGLRKIEPTDVEPGERLYVVLDPSAATASLILVVKRSWNQHEPCQISKSESHIIDGQRETPPHRDVQPPSMRMSVPVMKLALSEHRNKAN